MTNLARFLALAALLAAAVLSGCSKKEDTTQTAAPVVAPQPTATTPGSAPMPTRTKAGPVSAPR